MARIVVTGGAGFIGSHLCERLLAEGHEVICIDNLVTGRADNIAHLFADARFSFIPQDVTTYLYVKGELDAILHLRLPGKSDRLPGIADSDPQGRLARHA